MTLVTVESHGRRFRSPSVRSVEASPTDRSAVTLGRDPSAAINSHAHSDPRCAGQSVPGARPFRPSDVVAVTPEVGKDFAMGVWIEEN